MLKKYNKPSLEIIRLNSLNLMVDSSFIDVNLWSDTPFASFDIK